MTLRLNKCRLYAEVERVRGYLDIMEQDYPIDIIQRCRELNRIQVNIFPFATPNLRGMAIIAPIKSSTTDFVFLDEKQSYSEQNFYCAHELLHLYWHREEREQTLKCYDRSIQQDDYIEWQANEGAAEFLVPASMVLGIVKERYPLIKKESDVWKLKHELVNKFNVSDQIIKYRLEALKYEIDQCVNGVAINDIEFISRSVQNTRKLEIQSLNDLEEHLAVQEYCSTLQYDAEE